MKKLAIAFAMVGLCSFSLQARAAIPADSVTKAFSSKAAGIEREFGKRLYCGAIEGEATLVGLYFKSARDVRPQIALVHQSSERFGTTLRPLVIRLNGKDPDVTLKFGYASAWGSSPTLSFRHNPSTINMRFEIFSRNDGQGRAGMWVGRGRQDVGPNVSCFPKVEQAVQWMKARTADSQT